MNDPVGTAGTVPPPKNNRPLIIGGIVLALLCCCCVGAIALYYGYDEMGDPLGIYGALPKLQSLLTA